MELLRQVIGYNTHALIRPVAFVEDGSSELRSCVKVEVAVLGSPSLVVLMVSGDVKQH